MSRMLPQETVDQLRHFTDVSIRIYGIDCDIYVPTNLNTLDENNIYVTYNDYTYTHYTTEVFIEWSPDMQKLRRLGLHMEGELPILAWFANKFRLNGSTDDGQSVDEQNVDLVIGSYFKVDTQYIPDSIDADEFEIVDILIRGVHDKVALKTYKIAPRRVQT